MATTKTVRRKKESAPSGDGAAPRTKPEISARPSRHEGMGAIPYRGDVAFRVWAPYADEVYVAGTFNEWSKTANPLTKGDNGYWSADVREAKPGNEYQFILVSDGQTLERADPYARQMTNSAGNAVVYDPSAFDWKGDDFQMPPWNELVLYEMHIGTFNDQNPDGPGDLESGIARLDYLRDLGVNALSIMPLAEFAGDFSWGYNPAYIFAVESAYGGPDAFKRFVKEAHERGLAVVMDVVYNHFGPTDLDLWRFDGWFENDGGGIYFYNDHRAETPWGLSRPDYGRSEVRQYVRDNVVMWLEDYHLDGLRWDGTVFIRYKSFFKDYELPDGRSLMQDINREVRERWPSRLMIAEDLQGDDEVTRPPEEGGIGFSAQWDVKFVHPIRAAIITPNDDDRDMKKVRNALLHRYNGNAFERLVYTESHDEVANGCARVTHEINPEDAESWESKKRSTLGAALALTAPGIPMIFQGQEFLEDEWFCDTDPVDWAKLDEVPGIHRLYRDLIRLRRNGDGTSRGLTGQGADVHHLSQESKVLTMHRWEQGGPGDSVFVIANLANRAYGAYRVGFPEAGRWCIAFNSDSRLYSPDFSECPAFDVDARPEPYDGLPVSAEISIGPYTALLYLREA